MIRLLTDEELAELTIDSAINELKNNIYKAAMLVEQLEYTDNKAVKIRGNGHHIRQKMAEACAVILKERFSEAEI